VNLVNSKMHEHPPKNPEAGWESGLQMLAASRSELAAAIQSLAGRNDLPCGNAINRLISSLSVQDQIATIFRGSGFPTSQSDQYSARREALMECSATLAVADHLVGRYLQNPQSATPRDFHEAAISLREALSNLEESHEQ